MDELEHYKSREERVTKLVLDNSASWDALYKKVEAAEKHIEAWGVKYIPLSGNSPVIPGGWISCSERMPDIQTDVLIATVYDNVLQALLIADRFIDPSGMDFHLDEVIG
ncbi:DUF551 domain-containing protein [Salmonella enterica]|nr:DUF551 domain-containing protein [Salmonella enterica subsp. enterica serovar Newport]ECF2402817.1 DUF551 domain-containing protein [Salmonella enterica subsp. enterica serovar Singapore]ECZ0993126.1 DUF551 domain-containing protein [Salmonella enterica]ECJ6431032.1 DUF551 domain-containing protein [Salmonella enterica subsp. enterica serovar Newport]EDE2687845.1 DUF551 domain-containing protein [Salmonella enterica subsp. enterica serovar Singapore]